MLKPILIALSFIFGLLTIRYIRRFDVHEKEPLGKMLAVAAWGGLVSIILSLFLYGILQITPDSLRTGFPYSFLYIGLVEEGAKLVALFLSWGFIRREMDEPTDGLVYMACVALGFSLIENYFYAAQTPISSPLIAIRLIICTPMHIAFSIFMGLGVYWATRCQAGWGALLWGYLFASVYHALYDIFVSWWFLLPGLYFIIKGAYRWMYKLLGYTAAQSPFRKSLAEFIHTYHAPLIEAGLECLDCGSTAPKPTYTLGKIQVQQCEACRAMVCTEKSLQQLIHHFGSTFGKLPKPHPINRHQRNLCTLVEANRIDRRKKVACFRLDDFNAVLEKMSRQVIDKAEHRWWCSRKT